MWFKNLRLYRFTKPFALTPEQLESQLQADAFRRCGSLELTSSGWVPPLGRIGTTLVHAAGGCFMVCARQEERVLPASVVREEVAEKAWEIEQAELRPLRGKERRRLKEEVVLALLPRAFTRSNRTYAYIDARDGYLVIDASSPRRAEELMVLLRKSLGSLPVEPLQVSHPPVSVMTSWVAGEAQPAEFTLGDECELRDPGREGGVVRCKGVDLHTEEVRNHLIAGKQVSRLALTWNERLAFVLDDDLSIKRLAFHDLILEEADLEESDEAAQFDADFALMNLELGRFIPRLAEAFGGEDRSGSNLTSAQAS